MNTTNHQSFSTYVSTSLLVCPERNTCDLLLLQPRCSRCSESWAQGSRLVSVAVALVEVGPCLPALQGSGSRATAGEQLMKKYDSTNFHEAAAFCRAMFVCDVDFVKPCLVMVLFSAGVHPRSDLRKMARGGRCLVVT